MLLVIIEVLMALLALDDTLPPSLVPVATFTAKFAALIATIKETIADGVKNGGVRYFLGIIYSPVILFYPFYIKLG